jgi:hypothetical protein
MLWPYFILFAIIGLGWNLCKRFGFLNKKWLRWIVVFLSAVMVTNFSLCIFSKNIGIGVTKSAQVRNYQLYCGKVEVTANGLAKGDNGDAIVYVTIDGKSEMKLNSYFNYDGFYNMDPAEVNYAFKDLDPFVDLAIKTKNDRYTVSGLTGKISK